MGQTLVDKVMTNLDCLNLVLGICLFYSPVARLHVQCSICVCESIDGRFHNRQ